MSVPEMSGDMPGMSGNDLQFSAGQEDSMTGGGGAMSKAYKKVKSAIKGYEEYTLDGKKVRVYGSMNGMTPREYDDWFRGRKRASPPTRRSSPPLRRSARIAEKKRRVSMGGKRRRSRKNKKTRKSRK
jgi:hypothetical protein